MSHFGLQRAYFAICLLGLFGILIHGVSAQDLPASSLTIVPQDASFYWASMNHSAQWSGLIKSNAYQQLLGSPVGEKMRRAYPTRPISRL